MSNLPNTIRMYAEDMHSAIGHSDCSSAMSLAADLLEEQKGTIAALNIALGGADSTSTENLIDAHEFDIADVGLIAVCRKLIAEISELKASPLSEEALDILRARNKQLERAIDEEMVVCHLGVFGSNDDPRTAIKKLMQWAQDVGAFFAKETIKNLEKELAEWKNMSACEACATIPSVMEYVQQLEQERDQLKEDYQRTCHLVAQMHMAAMNGVIGPKRGVIEDIADLREERDTLAAQNEAMREALEGVMRWQVKNVEVWNNSAYDNAHRTKAALPYLAAEVLKRRDAETLRRAAEKLKVGEVWISRVAVSAALRLMAAELEKETACPAEASAAAPTRPAEALTKKGA